MSSALAHAPINQPIQLRTTMTKPESHLPESPLAPESTGAFPWYAALSLSERAILHGNEKAASHSAASSDPGPSAATVRRLERWRTQAETLDDAAWAAYFASMGLSPDAIAPLLEPLSASVQLAPPAWVHQLEAAHQHTHAQLQLSGRSEFLYLAEPMLVWATQRALAQVPTTLSKLLDPEIVETTLLGTLARQIGPMVERTLVLEMHIARLQGQLTGDTPKARFAAFTARLREPAVVGAILNDYPVLARQLINRARQTCDVVVEMLTRLHTDWPGIVARFFEGRDPGVVTEISLGEGDTHADGRAVAILTFAGGGKLVYKPRPLDVDAAFQNLLAWLNNQAVEPDFRLLNVWTRGDYGWVEFIHAAKCSTPEEVQRFYTRQGGYLALLYVLHAGDFHFENLIAAGEHPMLIDLEALFHPTLQEYDDQRPEHMAQRAIDESVLSVSMLPQRLQFAGSAVAIDISGMGAGGTQLTPDKLPTWEGVGTDTMQLRRAHLEFTTEGHRPELDGAPIDAHTQGTAVAAGFAQVYGVLQQQRAALLAPSGPLHAFAEVQIRIVARATRIYSLLLQEMNHPDLLRDATERDAFFARLWRDVAEKPRLAALVPSEVADLHNGDVPVFHTRPNSTHIWDGRGQRIDNYLAHSGLERVQTRLAQLSNNDCARQLWYIRAAFATQHKAGHQTSPHQELASPTASLASSAHVDFVKAARAIGDRLAQTAHRGTNYAIWIGLGLDGEHWSLNPLTMHLYDGHAGVALFLAYLGHITGDAHYSELARATLTTLRVEVEHFAREFPYTGAFNGWGGIIYTLAHLGALWQEPTLWEEALALADLGAQHVPHDSQYDIIAGSAGFIGALAVLWHCTHTPRLLDYMAQAADHLVQAAVPQTAGVGWLVPNMGESPLAGFSHGAAGIAWALTVAARLTDTERYAHIAHEALAYERSLYADHAHNWRDVRNATPPSSTEHTPDVSPEAEAFMHAWCHGAPGIGLGRLALLPHSDDPLLLAEIEAALTGTAEAGFGTGHSLCHGDMGNLELFVSAATGLARPALLEVARRRAQQILAQQAHLGWYCGVPGGVETPGLMVGLAGIGWELLRLADPTRIPSVLTLEPPAVA